MCDFPLLQFLFYTVVPDQPWSKYVFLPFYRQYHLYRIRIVVLMSRYLKLLPNEKLRKPRRKLSHLLNITQFLLFHQIFTYSFSIQQRYKILTYSIIYAPSAIFLVNLASIRSVVPPVDLCLSLGFTIPYPSYIVAIFSSFTLQRTDNTAFGILITSYAITCRFQYRYKELPWKKFQQSRINNLYNLFSFIIIMIFHHICDSRSIN